MREYYLALIRGERRGLAAALQRGGLGLISGPYGWGVRLRNWLFERGWKRQQAAAVPVVSVGNLSLGGTGKTPCVEYVARFFRRRGLRVAILSRGYGASGGPNDEALVLEANLPDVPHLQGPDRLALAATAVAKLQSQVLVLDDGFQHRRLVRDLDLVLLDATAPWGHGGLFPCGLLREPPTSLRRAQVILLTRCDLVGREEIECLKEEIQRLAPGVPIAESSHRPVGWINARGEVQPLEALQPGPVAAFCGIGNPDAFRRTLRQLGRESIGWRTFPDHHVYVRTDIDELCGWARQQPADTVVVTTQKDLVKLRLDRLGDRDLWALQIQLHFTAGQEVLDDKLQKIMMNDK